MQKSVTAPKTAPPNNSSKRWVFTLHGATNDQLEKASKYFDSDENVEMCVFSREMGEHGIHPHFQGYLELKTPKRMMTTFREFLESDNFHLEIARSPRRNNINYVYAVDKPYEIGWIAYKKGTFDRPERYDNRVAEKLKVFKPRPFQKEIIDLVNNYVKENDRTIHWFYEPTGNVGKSFLSKWLHVIHGAVIVSGRGSDIKHALARVRELSRHDPALVIVDLARSARITKDLVSCLESLKNGLFFSGKYDSGMISTKNPCQVIVFANIPPTSIINQFSRDRWDIHKILPNLETQKQSYEEIAKLASKRKKTP